MHDTSKEGTEVLLQFAARLSILSLRTGVFQPVNLLAEHVALTGMQPALAAKWQFTSNHLTHLHHDIKL